LAKKIVQQENILSNENSTPKEKKRAEQEIIKLCAQVDSLEDMMLVDELVQEMLSKNS
jgi:hypothetical protein